MKGNSKNYLYAVFSFVSFLLSINLFISSATAIYEISKRELNIRINHIPVLIYIYMVIAVLLIMCSIFSLFISIYGLLKQGEYKNTVVKGKTIATIIIYSVIFISLVSLSIVLSIKIDEINDYLYMNIYIERNIIKVQTFKNLLESRDFFLTPIIATILLFISDFSIFSNQFSLDKNVEE